MSMHSTYYEDIGIFHGRNIGLRYALGFAGSLLLTLAAYTLAMHHYYFGRGAFLALATLALLQFLLQLRAFLHLGLTRSSRERLFMLGFALVIVLILVSGSIWIMGSLDARMMPSAADMEAYMNMQPGI